MLTNQQLFDKVVTHLRTQGVQAAVFNGSETVYCKYRIDGKMCAAGCLIADEHYSQDLEGEKSSAANVYLAIKASIGEHDADLVRKLQLVHDNADSWSSYGLDEPGERSLKVIAKHWNLIYTPPSN